MADEIAPALVGAELDDPRSLDRFMIERDGTPDKHRLGGNAIYSTSIALLRAASSAAGTPTYTDVGALLGLEPPTTVRLPSFNMINGGRYGDVFQTFNEFLVMPYRADSIESAIEKGVSLFGVLGDVRAERLGRAPLIAPSYGYVAPSGDPRIVMEVSAEAVERAGCADVMAFALDCASSEVYDKSAQAYPLNGEWVTAEIGDVVMDLAVGLRVPFQKNGAPRSGERIEKLNFLLRAAEGIPDCAPADVPALVRF